MLSYYSEVNIHYKRNLLVALSFIEFITLSIFVKGSVEVYTIGTNDLKNVVTVSKLIINHTFYIICKTGLANLLFLVLISLSGFLSTTC